ncbi:MULTISPECIES: hypothetical protein [unclassified Roseateles]|uniref:hypothetical protein n=1 Tax=unclassified Roseateles TaxID=2626991 RepID=UPI0006FC67F1|nr:MULTISPECIES: hypothetical protein [unclassified Roseateles]KQW52293.1 hypothetical protein ASC81_06845 [Pelomonas sp. Root405]KRA78527.1 hypothetical protein ASD88_06850 [Pelomonas sp. Root662]
MQKKRQRQAKGDAPPAAKPWYQKTWVGATLVAGAIGTLLSGISSVLLNGPTYIANAEKMPGEFERVSNKFLSWLYEDEKWTGYFGTMPEAYADIEDMQLTKSDRKLTVHLMAERGYIGGEIVSQAICSGKPFPDYLLLEGRVSMSGDSASVVAWDVVGGKRQNYFTFSIEREPAVLTLRQMEGVQGVLPVPARVALYPEMKVEEKIYEALREVCKGERELFLDKLHEQRAKLGMILPLHNRTRSMRWLARSRSG